MRIEKQLPADWPVSRWSGGVTRQIAIHPEGASYADRDFLWRLSTARVEAEESDFTPLFDYDRLICTLEGTIRLRHGQEAEVLLPPLAVHAFDGAVPTRCRGTCSDFNLMLRKGAATGSLAVLRPTSGARITVPQASADAAACLYCVSGQVSLSAEGASCSLNPGEACLVRGGPGSFVFFGEDGSVALLARMTPAP